MADENAEDIWKCFDESVEYIQNVAKLYRSSFIKPFAIHQGPQRNPSDDMPSNVTTNLHAHLDDAVKEATQALELLATNFLNASIEATDVLNSQEIQVQQLDKSVRKLQESIQRRQNTLDQLAIKHLKSQTTDIQW